MSVLGFRLQERRRGGSHEVADSFMRAFAACQFEWASQLMSDGCLWFGEAIPRRAWTQRATKAHGTARIEAKRVMVVEGPVLAAIDAELARHVLDGVVDARHALQIFDVHRDDTWTSLGVLTRVDAHGLATIDRVIDLRAFKARFSTPGEALGTVSATAES